MTIDTKPNRRLLFLNTFLVLGVAACGLIPSSAKSPEAPQPSPTPTSSPTPKPIENPNFALHQESHSVTIGNTDGVTIGQIANWLTTDVRASNNPQLCHDEILQIPLNKTHIEPMGQDYTVIGGHLVNIDLGTGACLDLLPAATATPKFTDPLLIIQATATAEAAHQSRKMEIINLNQPTAKETGSLPNNFPEIWRKSLDFVKGVVENKWVHLWFAVGAISSFLELSTINTLAKLVWKHPKDPRPLWVRTLGAGIATAIRVTIGGVLAPISFVVTASEYLPALFMR